MGTSALPGVRSIQGLISPASHGEILLAQLLTGCRITDSGEQPVEILTRLLSHEIGNRVVGETVSQFAEEFSHFFLGRSWPSIWLMAQEGDGLLFAAKLALVADQAVLIEVAQTKIEIHETASFCALNSFPDQQIVGAVR